MMYRIRSLIAAGVFLVPLLVLIVWFVSAASNRCNLYQNLGYIYLAKGTLAPPRTQLGTAERWFSTSLLAECRAPSATFGLGQSYSGLGQQASAISALNNGEERSDLRHFLIGRIYEEMGRQGDAWREYRKLPHDAAAYFNGLADSAEREGDFYRALHYSSVSRMINPASSKAYYRAAYIYWRRLGDEDKAVTMIRQALAVDQSSSEEREFYRGLLCYREDKIQCAFAAWVSAVRQTRRIDPNFDSRPLAYEMLSRVVYEHGRVTPQHLAMVDRRQGSGGSGAEAK